MQVSSEILLSLRYDYIRAKFKNIEESLLNCVTQVKYLYESKQEEIDKLLQNYEDIKTNIKECEMILEFSCKGIGEYVSPEQQSEIIRRLARLESQKDTLLSNLTGLVTFIFNENSILKEPIRPYEILQMDEIVKGLQKIHDEKMDQTEMEEIPDSYGG